MQFGRSYEEFEVGATYKHWPGKTVTEYDDHLFCLLTMNHHPLHLDANYAESTTQFGKNVVVGNYIYSLLLGMSVPDVSGKAIANLEVESLQARRADLPRRHDLRPDRGPRQVGVEVQGRPRRGLRRDQGLQPGRHAGVHLPAQGDGAEAVLPRRPGRRAARAVPSSWSPRRRPEPGLVYPAVWAICPGKRASWQGRTDVSTTSTTHETATSSRRASSASPASSPTCSASRCGSGSPSTACRASC